MRKLLQSRWLYSLFCAVPAVLFWLLTIRYGNVLCLIVAVAATIATCAMTFLAVAQTLCRWFSRISPYLLFAVVVLILTLAGCCFGIYDMMMDESAFLPGLFGLVVLVGTVPAGAALLVADAILWVVHIVKKHRSDHRESTGEGNGTQT